MHRTLAVAALLLLAACGQKGPLYQPDKGIAVDPGSAPAASPASPAAPAAGAGVDGAVAPAAPTPAASPDRSDEARKRIPQPPAPAPSR